MPELAGATAAVVFDCYGAAVAVGEALQERGATVVLATEDEHLMALVERRLDATSPSARARSVLIDRHTVVSEAAQDLAKKLGRPEIWINVTTCGDPKPAEDYGPEDWERVIDSLASVASRCSSAGRAMLHVGGGVIVNVTSTAGLVHEVGAAGASALSGGVLALTRALGVEWASRGVRVVGVAHGALELEGEKTGAQLPVRRIPLDHYGSGADLGEAVAFLVGPDAAFISGEILIVDGGTTSYHMF